MEDKKELTIVVTINAIKRIPPKIPPTMIPTVPRTVRVVVVAFDSLCCLIEDGVTKETTSMISEGSK